LVTHDRYMLDKAATEILGLHQGRHVVCNSLLQWQEFVETAPAEPSMNEGRSSDKREAGSTREKAKGLNYNERREYQGIQEVIEAAEQELAQLQAQLQGCDAAADGALFAQLCAAVPKQQQMVDQLYQRWSELEAKAQEVP
jgi:ABC transport system ATP-binding/permease protein